MIEQIRRVRIPRTRPTRNMNLVMPPLARMMEYGILASFPLERFASLHAAHNTWAITVEHATRNGIFRVCMAREDARQGRARWVTNTPKHSLCM